MWSSEPSGAKGTLTCPFCGLACDDLSVETAGRGATVDAHGCRLAERSFAEAFANTGARATIRGRQAPFDEVVEHCAALLNAARAPLFAGLATDVNGTRATLELADRCGAQLDHLNGDAVFRNLLVLQDSGWVTTTFTEVRNRADLILVIGTESFDRFPRLRERVLFPPEALFSSPQRRELVLIGPWHDQQVPAELSSLNPTVIPVALREVAGLIGVLRGMLADRPVHAGALSGIAADTLTRLTDRLRAARYGVVIWSAAELEFPHAELTIQALVELVRDLNETTRAGALPLAGALGDLTVNQVCTWQTGFPLRTGLQQGVPRYEPFLYRHQDVLERAEADLLLWISALSPTAGPPKTDVPTIVLGHSGMTFAEPPEAYIPVGVPGVDHAGHWYRSDSVCPLPLAQVRDSQLPSVAQVVGALKERL